MTSQKPYLVRAIYEWCQDNDFTPHLASHVDKQTLVPQQYVQNSQIVLNISLTAANNLLISNDWVTFQATFGGNMQDIAIPVGNILAVFAKENGHGMQFNIEVQESKKSHGLKLVK